MTASFKFTSRPVLCVRAGTVSSAALPRQQVLEASSSNNGPMLLTRKRTVLVGVIVEVAMKEFVVVLFFLDVVAIAVVLMNSLILEG